MKKIAKALVILCTLGLLCGCGKPAADREVIGDAINYDVCKIGSPIVLEEFVQSDWDVENAEIMPVIESVIETLEIQDGTLQKEAIIKINKYLCDNMRYMRDEKRKTISNALVEKLVCCAGFSLAFECLAQYCGIDAGYVIGWVYSGRHAWNYVRFSDGSYCEIDVTWNQGGEDQEKFLFLTKTQMKNLHFFIEEQ